MRHGLFHLHPDPLGMPRNPFQVFILTWCVIAGFPLLLGFPSSGTVYDNLPQWATIAWGAMLVFGAGSTLVGMYWPGRVPTGLVVKRVGLVAVASAAFVFSMLLLGAAGREATLVAGGVILFGVACAVQAHRINEHLKAVIREAERAARGGHDELAS